MKILFRKDNFCEEEIVIASKYFSICENRNKCKDDTIICRYSALPYFKELTIDLQENNCKLIDGLREFNYIKDFEYYYDIKDLTFQSWEENNFHTCLWDGPFVVKGKCNSKKHKWNTHMFCKDRRALSETTSVLYNDDLIASQGIIIKKYEKLKEYGVGINGLPMSNEWRFFFLGEEIISYGYYWSNLEDLSLPSIDIEGIEFAKKCAKILSEKVNFFVVDIAQKEDNSWIMVEANHGYMSGLSEINPDLFYKNLKELLVKKYN